MTLSLNDVVGQIRSTLAITDPDLDTSAGSTTRKIIDAVAESIAESYIDQHMLAYTYDVDSKTGGDLDQFCQTVGGISRLAAKRASGTVTFSRSGVTTATVAIPSNTQINSTGSPSVGVVTVTGGSMLPGQTTVTLPVQAILGGPGGNVGANTLTQMSTLVEGVTQVTNLLPLTGGLDQETDNELRERWKRTAFRSMAGTESMYLGVALDDPDVTAAQVVGSSKRRREQIQISGGTATSTVGDAVYVYPTNVYVGANIDSGVLLLNGIDYTWDTTVNPPRVVINSGVSTYDLGNGTRGTLEGAVLDLDFEYVSDASRNDPTGTRWGGSSVLSRVDVWCAGQRPVAAQQSVVFQSTKRFTGDTTSPYSTAKFVRLDGTHPTANNVFLPLAYGPIIAVPPSVSIGGSTYGLVGAPTAGIVHPNAYRIVHDDTSFGYTPMSAFGLEWDAASLPAANTVFTMGSNGDYLYNQVPRSVQDSVDRWRLVGVDAKTHAAKQVNLRFNLAVMYTRGSSQVAVNTAIDTAIASYLAKIGLGGVVQVSDIENVVHNVAGVDNVRFFAGADYTGWTSATSNTYAIGIQRVVSGAVVQTYTNSAGRPVDIVFKDTQVPVLESVTKSIKAQNTFGAS